MIKITKAGWIYIGLTIFLGVAAVNTGNNLVYLIVSAMLGFMGISGFLGRRNISGLDLQINVPDEIFANIETPLKVTLINKKKFFPAFLISFKFEDKRYLIPYIDPGSEYHFHIMHIFSKRGNKVIKGFELCSVFPFNFFIRCVKVDKGFPVIVYPFPKKCRLEKYYFIKKEKGKNLQASKVGMQGDIISIREYAERDPLKYIHWKASAKTGELKTKELTELTDLPQIIDIEQIEIKDIEEKISCITWTIIQMYKKGIPFGLRAGKTIFPPDYSRNQKIKILKFLSEYGD